MIKETNPDIVIVATPNATHYAIVKACLAAKKHVLCEKPIAMNAAEAARVLSVAEKLRLRRDGAYAARLSTRAVDLLFEAGGGEFLYEDKPMQRAFRDIHAAQSHYALAWDVAASAAGKLMLGIAPDIPTL